jgi:hypothetical protein
MYEQIVRIKQKLSLLRSRDKGFEIFGASTHRYELKSILTEEKLTVFEEKYNIKLPPDYRHFLLHVGNGGAGPYYGLVSLEDGLYHDLDYRDKDRLVDPSKPFLFEEAWNMDLGDMEEDEDGYAKKEEEYYDEKWANGLLRLSNFGCGVSMNLVVNGGQCGIVWVDDRCNDGGIYPDHYFENTERIGFLTWYELWLDQSLNKIGVVCDPQVANKSWWQKLFSK